MEETVEVTSHRTLREESQGCLGELCWRGQKGELQRGCYILRRRKNRAQSRSHKKIRVSAPRVQRDPGRKAEKADLGDPEIAFKRCFPRVVRNEDGDLGMQCEEGAGSPGAEGSLKHSGSGGLNPGSSPE